MNYNRFVKLLMEKLTQAWIRAYGRQFASVTLPTGETVWRYPYGFWVKFSDHEQFEIREDNHSFHASTRKCIDNSWDNATPDETKEYVNRIVELLDSIQYEVD